MSAVRACAHSLANCIDKMPKLLVHVAFKRLQSDSTERERRREREREKEVMQYASWNTSSSSKLLTFQS